LSYGDKGVFLTAALHYFLDILHYSSPTVPGGRHRRFQEHKNQPVEAFYRWLRRAARSACPSSSALTAGGEAGTQQAADLLNVLRPYVVKLLDEGKIRRRTVGKYRRVRFDDLVAFKRKDDEARAKVFDQLTAEAEELGMGY